MFKNGALNWTVVTRQDGRRFRLSLGTPDDNTAAAIEGMIVHLTVTLQWDLIDALCDRKRAPKDLYASYCKDATLASERAALDDVDLSPLVAEWRASLVQRKVRGADDYVAQVRRLIPEGKPYLRSAFRRRSISAFLAGLRSTPHRTNARIDDQEPVSAATFNRYRSALRQFGSWLVECEVLEHNPVVDVRGAREGDGRIVWYEPAELRCLLERLPQPYRAYEAIMAATGMETQAVRRLRRRDIDLKSGTVLAWGSKTTHRNRACRITEAWTIPLITEYLNSERFTPGALLFRFNERTARDQHLAAEDVEPKLFPHAPPGEHYENTTLHDHRHSYSVNALRRGMELHVVAAQLGHANTALVQKRYGKFVPDASDYARWVVKDTPTLTVMGD